MFHISLVEPKPKKGTTIHGIGWSCIERLAESRPKAIIGAKDDDIPKFDGTNWHEWKFRIMGFLQAKGLGHTITTRRQDIPKQFIEKSFEIPEEKDKDGKVIKEATSVMRVTDVLTDEWKVWSAEDQKALGYMSIHM